MLPMADRPKRKVTDPVGNLDDAQSRAVGNAGQSACVAHGTALGVVEAARRRDPVAGVTATETPFV